MPQGIVTISAAIGVHKRLSDLRDKLAGNRGRNITYNEVLELLLDNSTLPELAPQESAK